MNTPSEVKQGRGTVQVEARRCKGCSFCIEFCPSHCLEFSRDFNAKGYRYPVLTQPADCSGCNLCGLYCPDFAIFGVKYADLQKRRKNPTAVALAA